VSASKEDIRKIIKNGNLINKILFLDEIHRFNKAQQDFLLPYVETGELILIGATPKIQVSKLLHHYYQDVEFLF